MSFDRVSIEDVFQTKYIFSGEVLDVYNDTIEYIRREDDTLSYPALIVEFKIINSFKGVKNAETVKLSTATNGGSCGVNFRKGEKWYVWTNNYSLDMYSVDSCSRTRRINENSETQTFLLSKYLENSKRRKWYDENGVLRAKGKYKRGKKKGKWKFYYRNSCLKTEGNYRNDLRVGRWIYYHEFDQQLKKDLMADGAFSKEDRKTLEEKSTCTSEPWLCLEYFNGNPNYCDLDGKKK